MRTIRSTRPALLVVGVAFAASVLAGCATQSTASSGASSSPSAAASSSSTATSSSSASAGSSASSGGLYGTDDHGGATSGGHGSDDGIATASTSLGTVVVDGKGMTAYFYDEDVKGSGRSTCTGGCAAAWPAIESDAPKPTVSGVTGTVGTITGVDGKLQVTVDGRPVYTYAGDSKAGDVTGQGVGGVWYAVNADGSEHR